MNASAARQSRHDREQDVVVKTPLSDILERHGCCEYTKLPCASPAPNVRPSPILWEKRGWVRFPTKLNNLLSSKSPPPAKSFLKAAF